LVFVEGVETFETDRTIVCNHKSYLWLYVLRLRLARRKIDARRRDFLK
jgi:hypothetical protein